MEKIQYLSIDLETRSGTDLTKSGVYRYVEDADFDILLFGYSINGGDVSVVDVASGEQIPEEILLAIVDESVVKWAYNATFERVCLSAWLRRNHPDLFASYSIPEDSVGNYLNPVSWRCSMIWAAYIGLPLSLEGVGSVLKLQNQKMSEGKTLIKFFSVPCKPTKANGGRIWNRPEHAPDKWATFKAYNKRDVEVEMAIQKKLDRYPVPDSIWAEYHLSEEINDRGIALDREMVEQAIALDAQSRDELSGEMQQLTQMENPNSVAQMKQWLIEHGIEVESLDKKAVRELLKTAPPELAKALELRQQLARSSVKKYIAMQNCVCADGRCRGMFQFYGANRSGRWAGRLIQLQNLPQNHISDLASARDLVKAGDYEMLRLLYEDVPDTLSQLIRTAFVPKPGFKFRTGWSCSCDPPARGVEEGLQHVPYPSFPPSIYFLQPSRSAENMTIAPRLILDVPIPLISAVLPSLRIPLNTAFPISGLNTQYQAQPRTGRSLSAFPPFRCSCSRFPVPFIAFAD